jgi:hypothetical protein
LPSIGNSDLVTSSNECRIQVLSLESAMIVKLAFPTADSRAQKGEGETVGFV